jgi:hypothetical protein
MSAVALDLLAEARRYGIRLVPTPAGTIKASAPKPPPSEFLAKLKAHRAELIAALTESPSDEFDERGAVIEYDADAPRAWAEALARLDTARPPGDVPAKRWRQFIDDCGQFLDEGWAARAVALGWSPLDLFGCDRACPFARIDRAGLLWLLNGNRLAALGPDTAAIVAPSGARMTYHRRPRAPDEVMLAWELEESGG